jgi:MoaA/NifB/PqqE/SkfB family radical SAM enzyme
MQLNELRLLEFELSSKCNAACPQCPRIDPTVFSDKSFLDTDNEISLQNVKDWFPFETLQHINVAKFMGSFSDPCIARDFFPIVEYLRKNTNNIEIHVHTNGSLRKPEWWFELGKIIGQRGYVMFGIDGLADTHSIYRINTSYEKVIENAKAFIAGGGRAKWQFIVFKHNQHQLEDCRKLSQELGFEEFYVLGSNRFQTEDSVQETQKGTVLEPSNVVEHATQSQLWNKSQIETIECLSDKVKWIMVDWNGNVFPCCYTMNWNRDPGDDSIYWQTEILKNNLKNNNLHHVPLKDVLATIGNLYQNIQNGKQLKVCKAHCSVCNNKV